MENQAKIHKSMSLGFQLLYKYSHLILTSVA